MIDYHHEAEKASFASSSREISLRFEFQRRMEEKLGVILSKADYNRLRRLTDRFRIASNRFKYPPYEFNSLFPDGYYSIERVLPVILNTRNAYEDLLEELKNNGMADLIIREREIIQAILSKNTLPQIDGYLMHRSSFEEAIRSAKLSSQIAENNLGEDLLKTLSEEQIVESLIVEEKEQDNKEQNNEGEPVEEKKSKIPKRLRTIAAIVKLAGGGILTATNISLGTIAGVFSAIPSLEIGTVAAAVGITTSCFTGLNTACDGLKDLAAAIESK